MLPLDTVLTFFVTALMLALAPGPDIIFVLTQSALYGMRAGVATTLGLISGLCFHTTIVAVGVAGIFMTSPLAFTLLTVVGAAYLLYLAWLSFRAGASMAHLQESRFLGYWGLYRRGVIMNITNPKVTLFFLAFLPPSSSSRPSRPWAAAWPTGLTARRAARCSCTAWPVWSSWPWP